VAALARGVRRRPLTLNVALPPWRMSCVFAVPWLNRHISTLVPVLGLRQKNNQQC